ncbi:MAG: GNAT family N-acetyltransferase [bacterium]|nr:GNAT family N-acetyltransferase [bacterium]
MIRKANLKDIYAIYSLLVEESLKGKVLKRPLLEIENVIDNFFVFEEEDCVIGCCSLEIYNMKIAEIRSLVVSSRHRNKGVGSILVENCLIEARKIGVYQVLSVTHKNELFQRLGFKNEINEKTAMLLNIG